MPPDAYTAIGDVSHESSKTLEDMYKLGLRQPPALAFPSPGADSPGSPPGTLGEPGLETTERSAALGGDSGGDPRGEFHGPPLPGRADHGRRVPSGRRLAKTLCSHITFYPTLVQMIPHRTPKSSSLRGLQTTDAGCCMPSG